MFRKPVKAALFDMDGLLIDSEAVYIAAMQEAARSLDQQAIHVEKDGLDGFLEHAFVLVSAAETSSGRKNHAHP